MDIDKNISDHTQLTADLSSSLSEKVENLTVEKGNVVIIDYKDLLLMNSDLNELIKKAYNEKGLGILAIKNVPGYVSARKKIT